MNKASRDRIVGALNHQETDMVPIDFASTRSTGINAYTYRALLEYLGKSDGIKIFDFKQLLAQPNEEMLSLFETDCVSLYRLVLSGGIAIDKYKEASMPDGHIYLLPEMYNPVDQEDGSSVLLSGGVPVLKRPKGGLYYDDCWHPLARCDGELLPFTLPGISETEKNYLAGKAKNLFENDSRAIIASSGISIVERGIKDWGFEEYLMRLYSDPDLINDYLEKLTGAYLAFLDGYLDAIGPYIQVIQCNDDLGMQTGPLISPEIYRKFFKPYHRRIFSHIKKLAPHIRILLHCCGSIYSLIPDLIEAGVDAINPVQINAAGMDPLILKREFGKDITFWGGGCATQTTLTFGSLDEIHDEVCRNIDIFAPGGGFVFNQVHNIQNNVSPERVMVLYTTVKEARHRK
jgi:uroporphyrinogen decarboxylase